MKIRIVILFLSTLLTACTNGGVSSQAREMKYREQIQSFVNLQGLKAIEQITPFKLKSYLILDDKYIAITGINRKSFLLTTSDTCDDLLLARKLNLHTKNENLVQLGTDFIARPGEKQIACPITNIYAMNEVQFKELAHLNVKRRGKIDVNFPMSKGI